MKNFALIQTLVIWSTTFNPIRLMSTNIISFLSDRPYMIHLIINENQLFSQNILLIIDRTQ